MAEEVDTPSAMDEFISATIKFDSSLSRLHSNSTRRKVSITDLGNNYDRNRSIGTAQGRVLFGH